MVVLIGGSIWFSGRSVDKNNEGVDTSVVHAKGGAESDVVLVEYSDFQCPACGAFQPYVAEVLETHGDLLRFEYKHFPLPIHPFAEQAARAAEAAGQQGKFFEFHDKLFAEQTAWSNSVNPSVFFLRYADELDLDMDTFGRQMKSTLLRDKVRASGAEARAQGLTGTPTFFLNGKRMEIKSYQDFANQISTAINPSSDTGSSTGALEVEAAPSVRFGI